ncbi:MAG: ABC transporter ATP-binding protein [Actinomycetes bacterium]
MSAGEVSLVSLVKMFDSFTAVDGIDLLIPAGEFFSLLGPSGCGKTTTLRMIAGFEQPTSGEVRLDGVDMSRTPASKRNVHTVFQSYALFPHMKVSDNIAFGLRRAKTPKAEITRRVGEALELVQMQSMAHRKPAQLSGGQQQRVALARALVMKPAVLLLDEPLGALDAKLRRQLQVELKALQEQVGITFVYVTHDQEEALTMSDRVAVMNQGRVEQVAPPREVYEEPASAYVADFLGVSNLMDATVTGPDGTGVGLVVGGGMNLQATAGSMSARGAVKVVIRPERVGIEAAGATGPNRVQALVQRTVYLGSGTQVSLVLANGSPLSALVQNSQVGDDPTWAPGNAVTVHLPAWALRVLDTTTSSAEPVGSELPG